MATNSSGRRRKSNKSPMTSIVIVAVALLLFVATVGIGISLLGKNKPANNDDLSSAAPPTSSPIAPVPTPPSPDSSVAGSGAPVNPGDASPATSGSSAPAEVIPTISEVFDPSIMGNSGYSGIANYQQINTDVKGWLNVPGTNINYPVLYDARILPNSAAPHFYFARNVYKADDRNGVIYADPAVRFGSADELSRNTVLYGHNWTNVSASPRIGNANDVMFAQLTSYHYLNWAKSHPYLYYSTEAEEMSWVIFAAFYTDVNFNYHIANPDDATFKAIVDGAKARSRHNFNVSVTNSDKIVTLSTCTRAYGQSANQRFVVMARLMRLDEEFVPITITTNPKPLLPKLG